MGDLKLNRKTARELLKDPGLLRALHDEAEKIAARAGDGYTASSMIGRASRSDGSRSYRSCKRRSR